MCNNPKHLLFKQEDAIMLKDTLCCRMVAALKLRGLSSLSLFLSFAALACFLKRQGRRLVFIQVVS
jgi:hypothetical protein